MIPELELLGRLRDAHPPADPSWWPPAPGWWLLLALALGLAALALRYGPAWWRPRRLRARLLAALEEAASAAEVSQVLRLAAVECFPQLSPAGLHGERWIEFLEARERAPGRFAGLRAALTEAPYAPGGRADQTALLAAAARRWLREVL